MTSSDTYTWANTIPKIVTAMYRKIGAIAEDETPTAGMLSDALFSMTAMVKAWATTGIHIWTTQEAILFLQKGQYRYLMGPTSTDHCCDAFSYSVSQLGSNGAAAATTLTLLDTTGFLASQNVGVVLDTGATFWTTQVGAPSGNNITLAAALPSNASANDFVFSYPASASIQSPLRVPSGRMLQWNGLIETPMVRLSRSDYMNYPNKSNPGTPTQYYYDPALLNGVPQGQMFVYLSPQNSTWAQRFTWARPLQDVTSNPTQTGDFPIEWSNACMWQLCLEMGPEYDLTPQRTAMIQQRADYWFELAQGWDREPEPVQFTFDVDQTAR